MTLKLTPQKAAELLKELQYAKVQMGGQLSIRDEYFKQALEKQPRWIPCSERMPEPFKDVLTFEQDDFWETSKVTIMQWDGDKYWQESSTRDDYRDATHWMPLPEQPTNQNGEQ